MCLQWIRKAAAMSRITVYLMVHFPSFLPYCWVWNYKRILVRPHIYTVIWVLKSFQVTNKHFGLQRTIYFHELTRCAILFFSHLQIDPSGEKLLDFYCHHHDSGHLIIGGLVKPNYYYIIHNTILYNLILRLIKEMLSYNISEIQW